MRRPLLRVLAPLALVAAAVAPPAAPAPSPLRVLATLPDLWAITRPIVGDLGEVQVATRRGQNPHDLEIRPSQVVLVKRAEILVRNGLDEDSWIDPVIESSGNPRLLRGAPSVIEAVRGLTILKVRTGPIDRSLGDVHPGGNPHFTLDPGTLPVVTGNIVAGIGGLRPDLAEQLEANRRAFLDEVAAGARRWTDALAPYRGEALVSYHDSWPYFYQAFGLEELGVIEDRPGVPPSPQHLVALIRQMRERRVKVVLVESWYPIDTSTAVARAAGARVLVLPQSPGAVKGTDTYIEHLDFLVTSLARALGE
ncbi:MAG TPA: metal ABC transporter substrate-binding protein [Methylomirabilota bacterium]